PPLAQRALKAQSLAPSTQRQTDQCSCQALQSFRESAEGLGSRGRECPVPRPTLIISYRVYIIVLSYSQLDFGTYVVILNCERPHATRRQGTLPTLSFKPSPLRLLLLRLLLLLLLHLCLLLHLLLLLPLLLPLLLL